MISGLLLASDGEKGGLFDYLDTPFYGGHKIPLRAKILSPEIHLQDGSPLISAPLRALFDAQEIHDVVIVGDPENCEALNVLASRFSNDKPYKVLESTGHVGYTIAKGSEHIKMPGFCFIILPDLPHVDGLAIDTAIQEIFGQVRKNVGAIFPVITEEFFRTHSGHWERPFFPKFLTTLGPKKYKMLDFVIADSRNINPEFVRKFYHIRMIRSLKGKFHAATAFPTLLPRIAVRYALSRLSLPDMEDLASSLNGSDVKIVEVSNPSYAAFMKDIDTMADYEAYLREQSDAAHST